MHFTIALRDPCTRTACLTVEADDVLKTAFALQLVSRCRAPGTVRNQLASLDLPETSYKQVAGALVASGWAKEMFRAACT